MKNGFVLVFVALAFVLTACSTPVSRTQKGAAIGTGVGAATGAALGQAIGRDTESTLIGAAAGAVVGGLAGGSIGKYMDRQEEALRQSLAYAEGASIQRDQNVLAVTFRSDVLFDYDSAVLKPGAYDEIDRVAEVLTQYPETRVRIEGHTDATGSESYNQVLSEDRARAVENALVYRGVDPGRIRILGFGESKPVATNATEAGRQLNRRVNIVITPVSA